MLAGPFQADDAILSRLAIDHFRHFIYRLRADIQLDLRHPTFKPDSIITMKTSSAILASLVTGTLGGVLAEPCSHSISNHGGSKSTSHLQLKSNDTGPRHMLRRRPYHHTMYTTAPTATTTAPANSNVACTYQEPDPGEGSDEPYCICTSGMSTKRHPDKYRIFHDTDPELRIQYLARCNHFDIDGSSPAEHQQQGLHGLHFLCRQRG